jgi:hypothetical protein
MVLAPRPSQGKDRHPHPHAAAGSGSGSADAPSPDDDEEGGSTTGAKLVAPADAKLRPAWLKEKLIGALASQPKLTRAKISVAWSISRPAKSCGRTKPTAMNPRRTRSF